MTARKLEIEHGCNILRDRIYGHGYYAYLGGCGTGMPVEDIARAYTLLTLDARIRKWKRMNGFDTFLPIPKERAGNPQPKQDAVLRSN